MRVKKECEYRRGASREGVEYRSVSRQGVRERESREGVRVQKERVEKECE